VHVDRDSEETPVPKSASIIEGPTRQVKSGRAVSRIAPVVLLLVAVAAPGCADDESRAEAMYREAVELAEDNSLEKAIAGFDAVVEAYPGTAAAERARRDAVLYRGLEGAVDNFPVHRVRDLLIDAARKVEAYRGRNRRPPAGLDAVFAGGAVPVDPWGRPLAYRVFRGGRSYEIASFGADGEEGGEGADADLVIRDGAFVGGPR
jgi:hypothetical protein